jgi:hypothetical protein
MKRALLLALLCFSSLLAEASLAQANSQLNIRSLEKRVFIGQAYPSGNVYFERLTSQEGAPPWPKELLILPLDDKKSALGKKYMTASFVKVMKDRSENGAFKSLYIPGAEGMDDSHDSCGLGVIKKAQGYEYLSEEDYFYTTFNTCEPNEGLGHYRTERSKYSFLVLGVPAGTAVADVKPLSGKRPLTAADRREIIKEKIEDKKNAAEYGGGCTTNPGYIDSAIQIAEIGLADGDLRLRLSTYENAGCAGHLVRVYILDALQGAKTLRKIKVIRPRGAI